MKVRHHKCGEQGMANRNVAVIAKCKMRHGRHAVCMLYVGEGNKGTCEGVCVCVCVCVCVVCVWCMNLNEEDV